MIFYVIKGIEALPDYVLKVQFAEGTTKLYDITPLFSQIPPFSSLEENPKEFLNVKVDIGGHGISWNDELDLSSSELWENGIIIDE